MDDVAAAGDGQTALALRLAKHLTPPPPSATANSATTPTNAAFSPVSVHAALALVAAGARGATLAQLLAFLGARRRPTISLASAATSWQAVSWQTALATAAAGRACSSGRRLGRRLPRRAHRRVRRRRRRAVKSEARTVNFANEPKQAVKMINEWVKKATDIINSIISPSDIDAATDLVLANAVYFKGLKTFGCSDTAKGMFYRLDGRVAEAQPGGAPVLDPHNWGRRRQPSWSPEVHDDDGTKYSMFVFPPDARDGLSTMVDMVTASPAFMYGILAEMKEKPVVVKLPKFDISFSWSDLQRDLGRQGLTLPFSTEAADLRGMFKRDDGDVPGGARLPTFLAKFAHRAVVKVNEAGTEAAAFTVPLCGRVGRLRASSSSPPTIPSPSSSWRSSLG
ncbi:unnamed protein product [Urochloa decumbens]|uniref:Serpin domain-containing protein n=1 Tax=Urochloa decumbens TaxID=240449 RepID=A0ABC9B1T3_9POAL